VFGYRIILPIFGEKKRLTVVDPRKYSRHTSSHNLYSSCFRLFYVKKHLASLSFFAGVCFLFLMWNCCFSPFDPTIGLSGICALVVLVRLNFGAGIVALLFQSIACAWQGFLSAKY